MADIRHTRDDLYIEAVASCGTALDRLARAYEVDPDKRRDLLQEIHVALWQSFENFKGRCSLKTWVYRVAHITATSVLIRKKMSSCHRHGDTSRGVFQILPADCCGPVTVYRRYACHRVSVPQADVRRSFPADAASMSCLEFYRRELERQRDANLSIWSWYILPMLPGAAMMVIAMAFMPALGPAVALFWAVGFTAGFIFTGVANKRAARRLQQEIDELRG
jgi:hypothetical protein